MSWWGSSFQVQGLKFNFVELASSFEVEIVNGYCRLPTFD